MSNATPPTHTDTRPNQSLFSALLVGVGAGADLRFADALKEIAGPAGVFTVGAGDAAGVFGTASSDTSEEGAFSDVRGGDEGSRSLGEGLLES
ncbi:MAG: hypothetical protein ACQKBT_03565 [Puniceicoccales bacterium]